MLQDHTRVPRPLHLDPLRPPFRLQRPLVQTQPAEQVVGSGEYAGAAEEDCNLYIGRQLSVHVFVRWGERDGPYLQVALCPVPSAAHRSREDGDHEADDEEQDGEIGEHDGRLPDPQLTLLHSDPAAVVAGWGARHRALPSVLAKELPDFSPAVFARAETGEADGLLGREADSRQRQHERADPARRGAPGVVLDRVPGERRGDGAGDERALMHAARSGFAARGNER